MTVFDTSIVDGALLSLVKTLLSSVLVDKVFESSDFKTSFDESLSTTASVACSSDESSLSVINPSSCELEAYESVTFTSLAYIVPTDNATVSTNIKVSNILLFKIIYLHNKINIYEIILA